MSDPHLLASYEYDLPPELIAAHPVSPRDAAKLLVFPEKEHRIFADLAEYLNPGDVLVLNESRVIPARLFGVRPKRETSTPDVNIEILLHKPQVDFTTWTAFARPAKRLKAGDFIQFENKVTAKILGREEEQVKLCFNLSAQEVENFLEAHGHVPLPPYIDRADETSDKTEYQTVYAREAGSVAAPTAGLHFTDALLERIKEKGVHIVTVTLHVGAGTFLPVMADDIRQHKMHSEWGRITEEAAQIIRTAKNKGHRIIVVGTTATRLLESAARETGAVRAWQGETDIFITPGFRFNVVDLLVTNFHLPKSTLLMLVSAFLGDIGQMRDLYTTAIRNKYRFYSYGDACLLTRNDGKGTV